MKYLTVMLVCFYWSLQACEPFKWHMPGWLPPEVECLHGVIFSAVQYEGTNGTRDLLPVSWSSPVLVLQHVVLLQHFVLQPVCTATFCAAKCMATSGQYIYTNRFHRPHRLPVPFFTIMAVANSCMHNVQQPRNCCLATCCLHNCNRTAPHLYLRNCTTHSQSHSLYLFLYSNMRMFESGKAEPQNQ
jgi:hypothetical protein